MQVQLEAFKKAQETMEEAKKAASNHLKGAIKETLEPLFAKYPQLVQVSWAQYTPYFNDGDPCIFHVRGLSAKVNDEKGEPEDWEDIYWHKKEEPQTEEERLEKDLDDFHFFLKTGEDLLQSALGDHSEITIDRELNVTVDRYDHD